MEYRYDIRQFSWKREENSFHAFAPSLIPFMQDGSVHPEAFPNQKKEFFIHNYKTNGFRRFRFIGEEIIYSDEENEMGVELYLFTQWIFESEDGIKCKIAID